jgi:hypothetical protein
MCEEDDRGNSQEQTLEETQTDRSSDRSIRHRPVHNRILSPLLVPENTSGVKGWLGYHEQRQQPITPRRSREKKAALRTRPKQFLRLRSNIKQKAQRGRHVKGHCPVRAGSLRRRRRRHRRHSRGRGTHERGRRGDSEREGEVCGDVVVWFKYKVESIHPGGGRGGKAGGYVDVMVVMVGEEARGEARFKVFVGICLGGVSSRENATVWINKALFQTESGRIGDVIV